MTALVVFGRAQGVWDELVLAQQTFKFDGVIGVGSASVDYPGELLAIVSFHAEVLSHWAEQRARRGYPAAKHYVSSLYKGQATRRGQSRVLPVQYVTCEGGSSGLIASVAAVELFKADHVVLAGIPMDADRNQYDKNAPWKEAMMHRKGWENAYPRIKDHVRSMSGWTSQFLGTPTAAWMKEANRAAA